MLCYQEELIWNTHGLIFSELHATAVIFLLCFSSHQTCGQHSGTTRSMQLCNIHPGICESIILPCTIVKYCTPAVEPTNTAHWQSVTSILCSDHHWSVCHVGLGPRLVFQKCRRSRPLQHVAIFIASMATQPCQRYMPNHYSCEFQFSKVHWITTLMR